MAWSTFNSTDEDIREALSKGDAVVAGCNPCVLNDYIRAPLHMHSVGVGTFAGGNDFEVCSLEVPAVNDTNVEVLAIQRCYAFDVCVRHGDELEVL